MQCAITLYRDVNSVTEITFSVKLKQISDFLIFSIFTEPNLSNYRTKLSVSSNDLKFWTQKSIWLKFFFLRMISHKICDCAVLISLFNLGSTQKSTMLYLLKMFLFYFKILYTVFGESFYTFKKITYQLSINKINQMQYEYCILYSTIFNIFFFRVLIISCLETRNDVLLC